MVALVQVDLGALDACFMYLFYCQQPEAWPPKTETNLFLSLKQTNYKR
jgi:hypothetical protein